MKKILLILISLYKFSFAYNYSSASDFAQVMDNLICTVGSSTGSSRSYTYSYCDQNKTVTTYSSGSSGYTYGTDSYSYVNSACTLKTTSINYYNCYTASTAQKENGETGICQGQGIFTIGSDTYQCSDINNEFILLTPVENGGYNSDGSIFCNSGYVENSGSCSAVPDNSSGFDENGDLICNSPYVSNGTSCNLPPNTNPDGTCSEGSYKDLLTNTCKPIETTDNNDGSTTTNDGNGETTDYPTGTTVNYNPETGVTTTTYPDGTSTTTYPDGTSSTGGGTDGVSGGNTGGGTGGGSEDTSGENNSDNGSNDLPSDNVADNCNDTNLTLQEKMLCELNEGMKKQNSELTPTDSLNNLMKDLRDNQMQDNTAMNQNLKDIESLNKEIKAINSSQLSTLNATKTATVAIASEVSKSNGFLESIGNGVTAITDFLTTITDLISDPSEIGTKLTDKLSEVANKFTQEFISVGTCPSIQTVSANYHGTTITFLSQDLINNYFPIDIMRTIIILTFAFSGAMTFFRGAN